LNVFHIHQMILLNVLQNTMNGLVECIPHLANYFIIYVLQFIE
jgi:hypothetical protein